MSPLDPSDIFSQEQVSMANSGEYPGIETKQQQN
mgnify:CR=1 FL=1